MPPLINIGVGEDVTIAELAQLVKEVVGYNGSVVFDSGKPDGPSRKLLDIGRLTALGWKPKVDLCTGIAEAYRDFLGVAG